MLKKIVSVFLILALTVSGTTAFAVSKSGNVLNLTEDNGYFTGDSDSMIVNSFNSKSIGILDDYEIIVLDSSVLDKVDTLKLIELINNGATLCIVDNDLSFSEISNKLGLPDQDDRFLSGAQVKGYFIFCENDNYCFGIIGVAKCLHYARKEKDETSIKDENPILLKTNRDDFGEVKVANINDVQINTTDFLNSITSFRTEYDELTVDDLIGVPYPYYIALVESDNVKNSVGSMAIVQYRDDHHVSVTDSVKTGISDVTAVFTITPADGLFVDNYEVKMRGNFTHQDVIDQGYQCSNDQYVIRKYYNMKQKSWGAEPGGRIEGGSWSFKSTLRVWNYNIDTYKTTVYSGFESEGWIGEKGILFVDKYAIPEIEVGGAWRFENILGDVNLDGTVSTADIIMLVGYPTIVQSLTENQHFAADMNRDGIVSFTDKVILARYIVSQ